MSPVYMCPSIEEDSYIVTALITGSPIPLLFGGTEYCGHEMVSKPNHLIIVGLGLAVLMIELTCLVN